MIRPLGLALCLAAPLALGAACSEADASAPAAATDTTPTAVAPEAAPAAQGGKSVKIGVEGMVCESCVNTITNALKGTPGVSNCNVSLDDKVATVTYDPGTVDTGKLAAVIKDLGYTAHVQ